MSLFKEVRFLGQSAVAVVKETPYYAMAIRGENGILSKVDLAEGGSPYSTECHISQTVNTKAISLIGQTTKRYPEEVKKPKSYTWIFGSTDMSGLPWVTMHKPSFLFVFPTEPG